jgi:hypothetical protein
MQKPSKSLRRMLGPGNPSAANFFSILQVPVRPKYSCGTAVVFE